MTATVPVNTTDFKTSMEKSEGDSKENAIVVLNAISKLVQDIEKKLSSNKIKPKECEELKLLKEKCCDNKLNVSLIAFHGINTLVKKKILIGSQTISILISLLPNISHYGGLVSTIGDLLLLDLQEQLSQKNTYQCFYGSGDFKHPFIIVLKHNKEKSWFPIYLFILKLMQDDPDEIKLEHKIKLLRPIFRQVFWSPSWRGSQFQLKLFNALIMYLNQKEILNFTLEVLMWQDMDIYYCLFLQDLFIYLLNSNNSERNSIISALTPTLALVIKWLILNGHDPVVWIHLLSSCIEIDNAGCSTVLYILSDVILETPSNYINLLIDVCKSIILNSSCNKFVAHKFVAVILNWMVNPSPLANPLYKTLEEVLKFSNERLNWNDRTFKLIGNKYYKVFGSTNKDIKFAVDLVLLSNSWCDEKKLILSWLKNLKDSNQLEIQLKLHSFIYGIVLCENDSVCINLCLGILLGLIDHYKDISFSHLCLIFYKLGSELDPSMQKTYLFTLPKLAVKKENIPLIVGIIESLKRGHSKIMTPLVVQLYLLLWKYDNRTYSYLHKMLHDTSSEKLSWELNISKAIALREICQLAPHLHAKDLVGVLSKILNECAGHSSGLPSAIAIEAVTELCKSYVIDVAGTWTAIQPKLRVDKRPQVIISLCKFFGEIPDINSSGQNHNKLNYDIVPMLWNYTFINNSDVVRHSFRALSKFNVENLPLKLFPEVYRVDIKFPKDFDKNSEDILTLPYVPAECWVQFIEKINEDVLEEGGELLTVIIERELNCLPRGIFYLPPEKSEPTSYSYLPPKSICRALVERLQRQSTTPNATLPSYIKEIIRVISHEYSKLLPPLNWSFVEKFLNLDPKSSHGTLVLLAKQGSVFKSARSVLENYLKTVEWNLDKAEDIVFLYEILPLLCKAVSYNIFQNFLEITIELCLQRALEKNSYYFEKILENLTKTLKNQMIQPGHKTLIAKQLEKILTMIPPEHEVMESYASCATEFPVQFIEYMTSVKASSKIESDWLRRAIIIRRAIAMRSDIKNPLVWLNEFTGASTLFPSEQNFLLDTIWTIIRSRRSCDHTNWLQELTWRIHASITNSTGELNEEILFLINVFISTVIVLSGHDCFFVDATEFTTNMPKKLEVFPQSLSVLLHFSKWEELLPKVALWLQKLSKWKNLPIEYVTAIAQSLLTLKEAKCLADDNITTYILNLYSLPFL